MDSDDLCDSCLEPGELVVCDGCDRSWHRQHHQPAITDDDMLPSNKWYCHYCVLLETERPIRLTRHGHLTGCYGQDAPNRIAPRCDHGYDGNGDLLDGARVCGCAIARQSCVVEVNGILFGKCPTHWQAECEEERWDHNLSRCANTVADALGLNYRQRSYINNFNIESRLGLPSKTSEVDTCHVSRRRDLAAKLQRKNQQAAFDRERINHANRIESIRQAILIASARVSYDDSQSHHSRDSDDDNDNDYQSIASGVNSPSIIDINSDESQLLSNDDLLI